MDDTNDRYAGDAAWEDWFRICSVAGCGEEDARRLRAQIVPAMMRRLAACGVSPEETQGEDPVAFFDAFFRLRGSREGAKPLKLWFAHRIRAEGLAMRDFVCGTLFGAASGRVHDIVVDWIAALKGWRPRTLRGEEVVAEFIILQKDPVLGMSGRVDRLQEQVLLPEFGVQVFDAFALGHGYSFRKTLQLLKMKPRFRALSRIRINSESLRYPKIENG